MQGPLEFTHRSLDTGRTYMIYIDILYIYIIAIGMNNFSIL